MGGGEGGGGGGKASWPNEKQSDKTDSGSTFLYVSFYKRDMCEGEHDRPNDSSERLEGVGVWRGAFRMSLNLKPLCFASWEAVMGGWRAAAAGQ